MMRWLLAVLIVLNLGLFLWTRMHAVPTQPTMPQSIRAPGVQDITLLREKDQQQTIPAPPEQERTGAPAAGDPPVSGSADSLVQESQLPDSGSESEIIDAEDAVVKAAETQGPAAEPAVTEAKVDEQAAAEPAATEPKAEELVAAEPAETEQKAEKLVAAEPVETEPAAEEPVVAEAVCGRIGPYTDKSAAEKYRVSSQHAGIVLDLQQTREQVRKGYWVLIPELPSRREARQTVDKLKAAGIKDLWLFTKGPMNNTISLGLYKGTINATSHSNDINKKGFNSEVRPRMSEQTRYWLDYTAEDEQVLADWLAKMPTDLQNEKKACE